MRPFTYLRPDDVAAAVELAAGAGARYLAGGTNLVDLMRQGVETPEVLVDVRSLTRQIEVEPDGTLVLGAGATNTAVAEHPRVRADFPLISRAILNGATGQIRNMATVGGNVLQRPRCLYFYDTASRCNRREPGAGCDALDGGTHNHAVLGHSPHCVATHPSDLCVALAALDARVHLHGPGGPRVVDLTDLHRLPGDEPARETNLEPYELITAVSVPPAPWGRRCVYRKVRERASYAFALVSVAAVLDVDRGVVRRSRLALGGVAAKPWRAREAERVLDGQPVSPELFEEAARTALRNAVPLRDNAYKIPLATRSVVAALTQLAEEPQEAP
ncbi:xanthine dehydrogenase family protein subunit M [Actinoplanes sp. NPDC051470]|uniref:FAD binding domain-containing protein n=1 Tax=Actinoplanes sp. NPDC051470 TaxID=3157224 RepID=UPI00343F5D13